MSGEGLAVDVHFGIVPLWLTETDVSDFAVRLYTVLAALYGRGSSHSTTFAGVEFLAEKTGRSERTVKRALADLIRVGAITRRRRKDTSSLTTIHRVRGSAVPSVRDENGPNEDDGYGPIYRVPSYTEHELDTSNDVSNGGKPLSPNQPVEEIFNYWKTCLGKTGGARLTPDRRRKIEARLRDGYTVAEIKRAIDGLAASPHHLGQNDQKKRYDDIALVCRNGEKLEWFRDNAPAAPKNADTDRVLAARRHLTQTERNSRQAAGQFPYDEESRRLLGEES